MRRARWSSTLLVLVAAAVLAVGCGGEDGAGSSGGDEGAVREARPLSYAEKSSVAVDLAELMRSYVAPIGRPLQPAEQQELEALVLEWVAETESELGDIVTIDARPYQLGYAGDRGNPIPFCDELDLRPERLNLRWGATHARGSGSYVVSVRPQADDGSDQGVLVDTGFRARLGFAQDAEEATAESVRVEFLPSPTTCRRPLPAEQSPTDPDGSADRPWVLDDLDSEEYAEALATNGASRIVASWLVAAPSGVDWSTRRGRLQFLRALWRLPSATFGGDPGAEPRLTELAPGTPAAERRACAAAGAEVELRVMPLEDGIVVDVLTGPSAAELAFAGAEVLVEFEGRCG